jgi:hypothetical protein
LRFSVRVPVPLPVPASVSVPTVRIGSDAPAALTAHEAAPPVEKGTP